MFLIYSPKYDTQYLSFLLKIEEKNIVLNEGLFSLSRDE